MELKEILQKIKDHEWWYEAAPGAYGLVGWPIHSFIEQTKYFHPDFLSISIVIFKDDFFYEQSPADEKKEIYKFIYEKVSQDKNYLANLKENSNQAREQTRELAKELDKNLSSFSDKELWESYDKLRESYLDFLRYEIGIESVDVFSVEEEIKKEYPEISAKEVNDIALTMTALDQLSFLEEEEILILEGAIAGYDEKEKAAPFAEELARDFFWIRNNYKDVRVLDEEYFLDRMNKMRQKYSRQELINEKEKLTTKIERMRKRKQELDEKYSFSTNLQTHFHILGWAGKFIDERKKFMTSMNYYLHRFCEEMGKRMDLSVDLAKYLIKEELKDFLLNKERPDEKVLQERRSFCAICFSRGEDWRVKEEFLYGEDAKQIFAALFPIEKNAELKGMVACAPVEKITGKVQVVLDVNKQEFIPGNILVTTMTRPDFVPLIRDAKAIITDEGGITCHASVVSRELGVPCVIGTKNATKILQTGDEVEIDLESGVVSKVI